MVKASNPFESHYVIDGVQMESTPARMLADCMTVNTDADGNADGKELPTVMDETADPVPGVANYDTARLDAYIKDVNALSSNLPRKTCPYPASYTKRKIAEALIGTLWRKGHFSLENLVVRLSWFWDRAPLGNMAAFYRSVEAAAEYLFNLQVKLASYDFTDTEYNTDIEIKVTADGREEPPRSDNDYDFMDDTTMEEPLRYCWICEDLKCSRVIDTADESDWLIYIPFDTCDFRLGDSRLEKVAGPGGDSAPDIQDPDYFIDCFEVVRELVEDGVIVAAGTVLAGGLIHTATEMCVDGGISIDVSAVESAYSERSAMRILFAEVPGVLIQIRDDDYDYIDSQMILQDIAYYPVGHPSKEFQGVKIIHGRRPGVSAILDALIQGQATEGED